ncbi:hypothetical protein GC167_01075 [bacterium]|nr:hypothetical protein [bacterium]
MQENSPKKDNRGLILILLLLLAVAVLGWFYANSRKDQEILEKGKEQLVAELRDLMGQYDQLELANDSLIDIAEAERAKLNAAIDSIMSLRSGDLKKLDQYKNQVYQLKVENKKLMGRLDSMSTRISSLEKEVEVVTESLQQEKARGQSLDKDNQVLRQEVAKGSTLTASGIKAGAIKRWKSGKETDTEKSRRADEIRVCFTLNKNVLAPKGERTIFMRVITPVNTVVSIPDGAQNSFDANGSPLLYSTKKVVWFENEAQEICMYVSRDDFEDGTYSVELFTEGYSLGTASFTLD